MSDFQVDPETALVSAPPDALQKRARRTAGVLASAAVADALGWMTEFARSRNHLTKLYGVDHVTDFLPWKKKSGGRFNTYIDFINPGEYSDDTQLTLCTARAIRSGKEFDTQYFAKTELPLWLDYARGAGATITAAARSLKKARTRWDSNFFNYRLRNGTFNYRDAGANGAAMRISPIAMAMADSPGPQWSAIFQNAVTTHGHPRAILGAYLVATALSYLIVNEEPSFDAFIQHVEETIRSVQLPDHIPEVRSWIAIWDSAPERSFEEEFERVRKEVQDALPGLEAVRSGRLDVRSYIEKLGCFRPATKGSGTSTALAALAYFVRYGASVEKVVIHAVNEIGTDTDTIAAMAAGLAGAVQGVESLPERWFSKMQDFPYLMRVADALAEMSLGSDHFPSLSYRGNGLGTLPSIIDLVSEHRAVLKQRVRHPIFGPGVVSQVDAQKIARRGGGEIMFATVVFDMGQTCKFKAYLKAGG